MDGVSIFEYKFDDNELQPNQSKIIHIPPGLQFKDYKYFDIVILYNDGLVLRIKFDSNEAL